MANDVVSHEEAKNIIRGFREIYNRIDRRTVAVSGVSRQAVQAVRQATKVTRQVAALMKFDEINRLKEKTASAGKGKSYKQKTGPTAKYDIDRRIELPDRRGWDDFWVNVAAGVDEGKESGLSFAGGWWESFNQAIQECFSNGTEWVKEHIWTPMQNGWDSIGGLVLELGAAIVNSPFSLWNIFQTEWNAGERLVGIGARLLHSAHGLWERFREGWGVRSVGIVNALSTAASTLWSRFRESWGTRSVSILNTLKNSASSLWEKFRSGWEGKTLGLKVTYNSNVSGFKRAAYRALGLSGWPSISFAARGGVFRNATLTMLGEAGTEAVVPLEHNTQWMEIMAEKLQNHMVPGGNITVPVYVGGEKLGEAVVDAINAATLRDGVSPIYI